MNREILENIARAVKEYDAEGADSLVHEAAEEGIDPLEDLDVFTITIREVGESFRNRDCFLPELVGDDAVTILPMISGGYDGIRT